MITVFTPTYNRGYIIDKLYKSLLAQTNNDFEWIVIDDGSTDDTEEYFSEIMKNENPFEIIYVKQPNGGKHRAINRGVKMARGDLFFIVDSDDYLLNNAIEKLISWSSSLDGTKKWMGISGLRGYSKDRCIGGNGKGERYIDAKNTDREKYNLCGDKAEAYFTEILKKYPFPEFEGENFVTEETVINQIAFDGYYIRWFNEIIYICDYLEDGLTKSGESIFIKNPQGTLCWTRTQLKVYSKSLRKKVLIINRYINFFGNVKSLKQISEELNVSYCFCKAIVFAKKIKKLLR